MQIHTINQKLVESLPKAQKELLENYVQSVSFQHAEDHVTCYFVLKNGYTFSTSERIRSKDVPSTAYEELALLQGIQLLEMAADFMDTIKGMDELNLKRIVLQPVHKDNEAYNIQTFFNQGVSFEHVFSFDKPKQITDLVKAQLKALYQLLQILGVCIAFCEHELNQNNISEERSA